MTDRLELAKEIDDFLEKHSMTAANYDPDFDEPGDRFNGPDSSMLFHAAECLRADVEFMRPFSDFESGCYTPISDKAVKAEHDSIVSRLYEYLDEHYPKKSPGM
jgi:hypothetical protein